MTDSPKRLRPSSWRRSVHLDRAGLQTQASCRSPSLASSSCSTGPSERDPDPPAGGGLGREGAVDGELGHVAPIVRPGFRRRGYSEKPEVHALFGRGLARTGKLCHSVWHFCPGVTCAPARPGQRSHCNGTGISARVDRMGWILRDTLGHMIEGNLYGKGREVADSTSARRCRRSNPRWPSLVLRDPYNPSTS